MASVVVEKEINEYAVSVCFVCLLNSLSKNSVYQRGFVCAFVPIDKTEAMYILGC